MILRRSLKVHRRYAVDLFLYDKPDRRLPELPRPWRTFTVLRGGIRRCILSAKADLNSAPGLAIEVN